MKGLDQQTVLDGVDALLQVVDCVLRKDLYLKVKETDWILLEFQEAARSLETIFRELTREN